MSDTEENTLDSQISITHLETEIGVWKKSSPLVEGHAGLCGLVVDHRHSKHKA